MGHSNEPPKPRLPDGTPSFEWMITDSIHTVPSRRTPTREAARLFGERYGFLLALADAFRDDPARTAPLRRMFEVSRGIVSQAKLALQRAWDERTQPTLARAFDDDVRVAQATRGTQKERARPLGRDAIPDPFADMPELLDQLDREPDRTEAAIEFAHLWARLRYASTMLRDAREKVEGGARLGTWKHRKSDRSFGLRSQLPSREHRVGTSGAQSGL